MVQASYDLRAVQQTALTPRLQQSVKLLQMSSIEFAQELQQALATNPFLEEDTDPADPELDETGQPVEPDSPFSDDDLPLPDAPVSASDAESEIISSPQDDPLPDYSGDYPVSGSGNNRDEDEGEYGDYAQSTPELHEHLHNELSNYRLSDRDRMLGALVIEALDDDGYLRQEFDELAGLTDFDPPASETEWSTALKLVQQLDIPGIGARDLRECLLLQLNAMGSSPVVLTAKKIVDKHLDRLAKRDMSELQRLLNCDEDAVREASQMIRHLDPKPGLRFSRPDSSYIVPDVIVRKVKDQWVVQTNPAVMPKARLNRTYADLFRRARCSDRAPMAQELQEARWLIRNAEQRFTTIQRVAEAIVAYQKTFLEYGEVALRPLVLREVAEQLGLHESTISRATGNKYMATPRGIFEFKHFFSRELATETGGSCSAAAVRALLKEMISAESQTAPLSDVSLTKMLADQGVIVARRTVAKYRGLMKVPPAELRRGF